MDAIAVTTTLEGAAAEVAVRAALAEVGFGILTEIDLAATLKAKIDVDRPPLKILGACNPQLAHKALELDHTAALALPCNVVLEPAPSGGTRVSVVDPRSLMEDPAFAAVAGDAAGRIATALETLPS